jgi:MFS transporter, DHA1 family, multidrug resistance protein
MKKSISHPIDWRKILLVAVVAQAMTGVGFQLFAPFLPLYVRGLDSTFGISPEFAAGLALGSAGFAQMFSSALWGAIADRYGRKLMLLRATFGAMILLGLMAFVTTSEQLIVLRLIQGFLTGTVAATNALVAGVTPRHKIGFAMSMLNVGLWGGQAVGPLIGGVLADAFGYSMPFMVTSVLLALAGVLIVFGIHEEFTPSFSKRPTMLWQWRHALAHEGVPSVFWMRFLTGMARNILTPIAPLFVVFLLPANTPNQATYTSFVVSVASITTVLGGVYFGRKGDKWGQRRVLMGCAIGAVLLYLPQVYVTTVWQLIGLQALAGIAFGGMISSLSAILATLSDSGEEGAIYGIDGSIGSASFAVAPMLGALVSVWIGMRGTFAFTALLYLVVFLIAYTYLPKEKRVPHFAPAVGD